MPPDPPSHGSEYEAALSGVLARAKEVEGAKGVEVAPRGSFLARPEVAGTVGVIFLAVVAGNLVWARQRAALPPPAEFVPPAQVVEAASVTILAASQAVARYRDENGRLPESLADVGLPEEGMTYQPLSNGDFVLKWAGPGEAIEFDSRKGPAAVLEALGVPVGNGR